MNGILLTLALATIPHSGVVTDSVETVEINSFFDDEAKLIFVQAIFYDSDDTCRDWRLVKNLSDEPRANIEVRRDYERGDYVAIWQDGETLREVRAKCYRETFTQYDPELVARNKRPTCERKLLSSRRLWREP